MSRFVVRSAGLRGVGPRALAAAAAAAAMLLPAAPAARATEDFPPFAIPGGSIADAMGATPTITNFDGFVAARGEIRDITVTLHGLSHTFARDLACAITHIDTGTSVALFFRPQTSADFGGTYVFNDEFTGDLPGIAAGLSGAQVIPPGPYFPTTMGGAPSSLLAFQGEQMHGIWRLSISDSEGADVGTLQGASLSFAIEPDSPFVFVSERRQFDLLMSRCGHALKAVETFEEAVVAPGESFSLTGLIQSGVPNVDAMGRGFPAGLSAPNLIVRTLSTQGTTGSTVVARDFSGAPTVTLFPAAESLLFDLTFTSADKLAIGLDFRLPFSFGLEETFSIRVTLFNEDDDIVSHRIVPARDFIGVVSEIPIRRMLLDGAPAGGPGVLLEFIDNIEMWTETGAACSADLSGDGQVNSSDLAQLLATWGVCP